MTGPGSEAAGVRVGVLADDLIWRSRLDAQLRTIGAEPALASTLVELEGVLDRVDAVVVDLTARRYEGLDAVRRATTGGRRVLAIGQHDDHNLRRRALEAGAERVLAYRKLADDGPATLARWLAARPVPS